MNTKSKIASKSPMTQTRKTRSTKRPNQKVKVLIDQLKKEGERSDTFKKSKIVASLMKSGLKPKAISQKTGISPAHVYNMSTINNMPEKVKHLIKENRIQSTDALKLSRKQRNEKEFIDTVEKFIKDKESSLTKHVDADILRKEQVFQQASTTNLDTKIKNKVEKFVGSMVPTLSPTKLEIYTTWITQTIMGAAATK